MSLIDLDLERDVSETEIQNKTSFEITSLTASQTQSINAFVAQAGSTAFLSNAQGSVTTIPLSSAFRHIANYYFSSTAGNNVPVSHATNTTTSTLRAIQAGRTTIDDGFVSGTVTAVVAFGITGNNTFIDIPETTITGSVGRKGTMVSQSNTSHIVGNVYYDSGTIVFHGGTGVTNFLADSASGFTFGSASAGKVVVTQLSFKALNVIKRTNFFCRAFNKELNYTNNPTSLSNITDGSITASLTANPRTYITTVGLHNDAGELLAVAKVSPTIKKTFDEEVILNVRLNY